jgi:hypothetical protein
MYVSKPRGLGDVSAFTSSLASSIARFEGYGVAGSVAQRNNNPGNLRAGPGQTGTDANGYAIFPDAATGYAALDNQIDLNINRGLTLNQFFAGEPGVYAGYAPSADSNNPTQYAATVAGWMGIDPTVPLSTLAGGSVAAPLDTSTLAPAVGSDDSGTPADSSSSDDSALTADVGVSSTVLVGGAIALAGLAVWWALS